MADFPSWIPRSKALANTLRDPITPASNIYNTEVPMQIRNPAFDNLPEVPDARGATPFAPWVPSLSGENYLNIKPTIGDMTMMGLEMVADTPMDALYLGKAAIEGDKVGMGINAAALGVPGLAGATVRRGVEPVVDKMQMAKRRFVELDMRVRDLSRQADEAYKRWDAGDYQAGIEHEGLTHKLAAHQTYRDRLKEAINKGEDFDFSPEAAQKRVMELRNKEVAYELKYMNAKDAGDFAQNERQAWQNVGVALDEAELEFGYLYGWDQWDPDMEDVPYVKQPAETEVPDWRPSIETAEDLPTVNQEYMGPEELPMDYESRMQRAREMGFDPNYELYHGSTHDIGEAFHDPSHTGTNYEANAYWGPGVYTSTSIDDVNMNYAGYGPDLSIRIEGEMDNIQGYYPDSEELQDEILSAASELGYDYFDDWDTRRDLVGMIGVFEQDYPMDFTDILRRASRNRIAGETEGVVYPLMANMENVVRESEPFYELEDVGNWDDYMKQAREDPSLPKDAEEYDIEQLAEELRFADQDIKLQEAHDSLYILDEAGESGAQAKREIIDRLLENGQLTIDDVMEVLLNNEVWIENWDTGGVKAVGDLAYEIAEDLGGIKGIIQDAERSFPFMPGTAGAEHLITRDPSILRSPFAKFDPKKKNYNDLLAGLSGPALLTALTASALREPRPDEI